MGCEEGERVGASIGPLLGEEVGVLVGGEVPLDGEWVGFRDGEEEGDLEGSLRGEPFCFCFSKVIDGVWKELRERRALN